MGGWGWFPRANAQRQLPVFFECRGSARRALAASNAFLRATNHASSSVPCPTSAPTCMEPGRTAVSAPRRAALFERERACNVKSARLSSKKKNAPLHRWPRPAWPQCPGVWNGKKRCDNLRGWREAGRATRGRGGGLPQACASRGAQWGASQCQSEEKKNNKMKTTHLDKLQLGAGRLGLGGRDLCACVVCVCVCAMGVRCGREGVAEVRFSRALCTHITRPPQALRKHEKKSALRPHTLHAHTHAPESPAPGPAALWPPRKWRRRRAWWWWGGGVVVLARALGGKGEGEGDGSVGREAGAGANGFGIPLFAREKQKTPRARGARAPLTSSRHGHARAPARGWAPRAHTTRR